MWFVLFLQELNNTCFNASVDCAKYNKTDDFQDIWADCEGKNAMITFLVLYALTIGGVLIMGFRQAIYAIPSNFASLSVGFLLIE